MNPLTPRELIDGIKAVPVLQMLRRLRYRISPNHRRFGPCPECGADKEKDRDRDPHVIRTDGKGYHCYGPHGGIGCGHSGGSLELLLHHHRLDPKRMDDAAYACMRDYLGEDLQSLPERLQTPPVPEKPPLFTHRQVQRWWGLLSQRRGALWQVTRWLADDRGIGDVADNMGGVGIAFAPTQLPIERPDLREAAAAGPCAAFPLYSLKSGDIANVVIRPLTPFLPPGQSKAWKARTLNAGPDTTRDGGWPLVYGSLEQLKGAHLIVICEGALDQLTLRAMSPPDVAVFGAFCADDIPLLAAWLKTLEGLRTVLVPHIDKPTDRHPRGIGWGKMEELAGLTGAGLIEWRALLLPFGLNRQSFRESGRSDINDLIRTDNGPRVTDIQTLTPIWQRLLEEMR